MLKVRNLGSHNSDSICDELDNGTFDQGAFSGLKLGNNYGDLLKIIY